MNFVKIYVEFESGTESVYIIQESDVDKFVAATLELHYNPGKNPHNDVVTSRVKKITKKALVKAGPYWWSTPGLQDNYDPNGVAIYDFVESEVIWTPPRST